MLLLADLYAIAGFVLRLLGLKRLGEKAQGRASQIRAGFWKSAEKRSQLIKKAEQESKRWEHISELTPEQRAALWKSGELNVESYNRSHYGWVWRNRVQPRRPIKGVPSPNVFTGPRGGRYRIDDKGRKRYDVP